MWSLREFNSVPEDLVVPGVTGRRSRSGKRVKLTAPGFEGTAAHHMIYLPIGLVAREKISRAIRVCGKRRLCESKARRHL